MEADGTRKSHAAKLRDEASALQKGTNARGASGFPLGGGLCSLTFYAAGVRSPAQAFPLRFQIRKRARKGRVFLPDAALVCLRVFVSRLRNGEVVGRAGERSACRDIGNRPNAVLSLDDVFCGKVRAVSR